MKEYFYYFRDEEKRPLVTVCILSHGDKIARGLAVIGTNGVTDRLSDNPRKIMGRALAKERAYLALLKEETDDKGFWHRHVFFTFLNVFGVKGDGTLAGGDIQQDYGLTLSATGNVEIMDHLTYSDDPTSNPDADNIFGVFSSNGNIYLDEDAPNDLTLHATVMAASDDHGVGAEGITAGGWYNYNYPDKGNWNLLGGLIENKNQTTGVFYSNGHSTGYTWNFDYDERFAQGAAPPYFPYVTKFIIEMQNLQASNWGRRYY